MPFISASDLISKPYHRIISTVPSLTETLVDLNLENEIVGITKFCIHPERLKREKHIIGGTKNLRIDEIKTLSPDLIICNKEENEKNQIAALAKDHDVYMTDIQSIQDAKQAILDLSKINNNKVYGLHIVDKITIALADFEQNTDQSKTKIAYFIWKDPWLSIGNDTFIHHMLAATGFENVYYKKNRYPEVNLNDLVDKLVDFVFLSSEPFPFKEKHFDTFEGLIDRTKIILVDGEAFSWYGSRLIKGLAYIKELRKRLPNEI